MISAGPAEILLWRALMVFLLSGALSGIMLALVLIFRPHLVARLNGVANRLVSTRRLNRVLDRSISIERWLYQRHRILGMLIVSGACYILVYFGLLLDRMVVLQRLSAYAPWPDMLLDAFVLALLSGAVVALFAGMFFWLRPSLLRGIEESANQWVSLRRATRALDVPRDQMERFVAEHAGRVGWLLLMGSIYLFFAAFRILI